MIVFMRSLALCGLYKALYVSKQKEVPTVGDEGAEADGANSYTLLNKLSKVSSVETNCTCGGMTKVPSSARQTETSNVSAREALIFAKL